MKKTLILSVAVILSLGTVFSFAQDKVGTAAGQFLMIPVGGKAIAMGGAFTAVSDDPTALFWNPGAISRTKKNQVYASQTNWLVDTKHQWIGAQFMITSADAIGVCFNNLDYGSREKVTTVDQPEGTGEYWEANDLAFGLSYARNLTDRFSIGGSVKYIQQKIWHESSNLFALDLGLLFISQFNGLQIGASMRNFGGELIMDGRDLIYRIDLDPDNLGNNETIVAKLKTDKWPIPLTFSVGAMMPVLNKKNIKLTLAADAMRPTDNSETINLGAQLTLMRILDIRAGYQSLFRKDQENGLTLGIGLNAPVSYVDLNIDLSYQEFGLFGNVQTTAISVGF
ncbi:MAG: PorV/PorQ family protein [Candidatus Neomarinimicrobiota bacterium]